MSDSSEDKDKPDNETSASCTNILKHWTPWGKRNTTTPLKSLTVKLLYHVPFFLREKILQNFPHDNCAVVLFPWQLRSGGSVGINMYNLKTFFLRNFRALHDLLPIFSKTKLKKFVRGHSLRKWYVKSW